jgi:hypothetical protein
MLSQGIAAKAVRDVWLAAPRSVASYMVNALKLETNPFAGIKVDGVKAWKEDDERGFDPDQALTILSAGRYLLAPDLKGDEGGSPLGAMDLRLHGRPRKRDHVSSAVRRPGGPQPLVVCTENLKSDHSGDEVRPGWRANL